MDPRRASPGLSAFGLLVLLAAGCRAPVGRPAASITDSFASFRSGVADVNTPGGSVWFAERTQALSAYAVELRELFPLQFAPRRTLRCFILKGRVRVRVGAREETLGPGGFLSVPPRVPHRILPMDKESAHLLLLLSPDDHDAAVIEMPGVWRLLRSGGPR